MYNRIRCEGFIKRDIKVISNEIATTTPFPRSTTEIGHLQLNVPYFLTRVTILCRLSAYIRSRCSL